MLEGEEGGEVREKDGAVEALNGGEEGERGEGDEGEGEFGGDKSINTFPHSPSSSPSGWEEELEEEEQVEEGEGEGEGAVSRGYWWERSKAQEGL